MSVNNPMGTLLNTSLKEPTVLASHSVVGRGPTCVVHLADAASSNAHASISWNGECWEVRDLGSTNGTWVDGTRLPPQTQRRLSVGTMLRFGRNAEQWELIDARGPVVVAHNAATGEMKVAEHQLLVLGDDASDHVSILEQEDNQWFVETSDGSRRLAKDGETISIAGEAWSLLVPPAYPVIGTYKDRPPLSVSSLMLHFHVSPDEKHIRVDVLQGDDVLALRESVLFEVLLHLARKRYDDALDGTRAEKEQGWYDAPDLAHELGHDDLVLNVKVRRLRALFIDKGIEDGRNIVERRTKKLRIGARRFQGIDR